MAYSPNSRTSPNTPLKAKRKTHKAMDTVQSCDFILAGIILMSRLYYYRARMRLQMHMPISKMEIGKMMVHRFGGKIIRHNQTYAYRMESISDFRRLLRVLNQMKRRVDVPQVKTFTLAIQDHITPSLQVERNHRRRVRNRTCKQQSDRLELL